MLSIRDGEALTRVLRSDIDHRIKGLLRLRYRQLGGDIADQAHFAIVQPADTAIDLERTVDFSIFQNPADGSWLGEPGWTPGWEWIEDHGFAYELCFIMDDSGFGRVIVIPKIDGVDRSLIDLCATYASEQA